MVYLIMLVIQAFYIYVLGRVRVREVIRILGSCIGRLGRDMGRLFLGCSRFRRRCLGLLCC
jgi:hypothetical protein